LGKNKLKHFAENETFPMFIQPSIEEVRAGYHLQNNWSGQLFGNNNPIIIELACGKGEYTVGLARKYPNRNFIGIDRKGARMWRGMKTAVEESLPNVAFLRTRIDFLNQCFGKHEISEIWITFPDPQIKNKKSNIRLTSNYFLSLYASILIPDGKIHLKTDNIDFFKYTLAKIREFNHHIIIQTEDLYNSKIENDAREIQTFYEMKFREKGLTIKYILFTLNLVH
jgi:tRNA (guanine-N7-)-methyltransferase